MKKIQFKRSFEAYLIDSSMARVTDTFSKFIRPNEELYIVGNFDKGIIVNIHPEHNDNALAVHCSDTDYIIIKK